MAKGKRSGEGPQWVCDRLWDFYYTRGGMPAVRPDYSTALAFWRAGVLVEADPLGVVLPGGMISAQDQATTWNVGGYVKRYPAIEDLLSISAIAVLGKIRDETYFHTLWLFGDHTGPTQKHPNGQFLIDQAAWRRGWPIVLGETIECLGLKRPPRSARLSPSH